MLTYAVRDLVRNPRRTLAALVGVVLGVGLFSSVLFFIDASGATMTRSALAPVDIDMQRVLTNPLGQALELSQEISGGRLRTGQQATMTLTVTNPSPAPAHEVQVKDRLPAVFAYVPGSTRSSTGPVPDVGRESPFLHGAGHVGYDVGTLAPGQTVSFRYLVRATRTVSNLSGLSLAATVSSREHLLPILANHAGAVGLARLTNRIGSISGVASADELAFADLPSGSLRAGHAQVNRPIKVFGIDHQYADHFPKVRLASGSFRSDGALLSPSAARTLHVRAGDTVELRLPGGAGWLTAPVTGIVDLSRARALFNSREGNKLEEFLYVPDSVVISPRFFADHLIPAFRDAIAARGQALAVKSPPTLEVDVLLDRTPLSTDPGTALAQTKRISRSIKALATGQDFVLDNASNALTVARADASVAKRMFVFLGLPGLVLAGVLAAYAGAVLAATQRREHALLRLRGADSAHLNRMLVHRTLLLAGIGSVLGTLAGLASCGAVLGVESLRSASGGSLIFSAALSLVAGMFATGLALYLPSRRALGREVAGERRALAFEGEPVWRRRHLDALALAVTAVAAVAAQILGAFEAPKGNVTQGVHTDLRPQLLVLPLTGWLAGVVVGGRLCEQGARLVPISPAPRFGQVVWGLLARTVSRRSRSLFVGLVAVGLVVGIGTGLAVFATSYNRAKAADARFTVGAEIRVTPSPLSRQPHPASYAEDLMVPGVASTTPVVAGLENSTLRSTFNSDAETMAAIDPAGYTKTVDPADEVFVGSTAHAALQALARDPRNVLLDEQTASLLELHVGDSAKLLMARGTAHQQLRTVHVVSVFTRLPAFPEGVNVVTNLGYYRSQTGLTYADFFLASTRGTGRGLAATVQAIRAGPGSRDRLSVETVATSRNRDASSLTALNIRGLLRLDTLYTLAMSVAVITMFVFAMMLHRRKEYVVLAAQGLTSGRLFALLLGETALVSLGGLAAGLVVGAGLGVLLVRVLTPLFILTPHATFAPGDVALLVSLVVAAMMLAAASAFLVIRSLSPAEVLRDQ